MTLDDRTLVRLEVQEASGSWLDILGRSAEISVDRDELNVSTISVKLFDANLDPTQNELIRSGRPIRLLTVHGDAVFTGVVLTGSVGYRLLAREERKRAEVNLTAVDPATALASFPSPEGVGTIPELPYVLAGTGVDYTVNGGAGTGTATVVSYNENASALDQVALTRDSRLGYAWVDRTGVLRVWDADQIPSTVVRVLAETDYLADINLDVDLDRLVNSVTVKVLAVVATSGAIEEIAFGPYVDLPSYQAYGEHRAEYTVHGFDATDAASIQAYADQILAANAQPWLRVNSLTLPIRSNDDLPKALLDLYDLVTVVNARASLDEDVRITTVSHRITADKNVRGGAKWLMTVGFVADGSVAPSTAPPSAPAIVRDVLDDVNTTIDELDQATQLGLQEAYDRADQAAADAAAAAATATTAQASANGKNTIWYSTNGPGTTPNQTGDVWFQKDPATQGIIAQYEGLGGTSWAARQLRNEVIANLDAGKLTAGSAFTNALTVKTNFTLGDASTNGVIQSYNFAGSSVGVFIDKFGLVAKGGTIAGATITGGVVRTSTGANRVELESDRIAIWASGSDVPATLSQDGAGRLVISSPYDFGELAAYLSLIAGPSAATRKVSVGAALEIQSGGDFLSDSLPKRAAMGTASVTFAAGGAAATTAVSFPAGRFQVTPRVVVTVLDAGQYFAGAQSVSTSGCTVSARHWDGTSPGGPVTIAWMAFQED